MTTRGKPFVAGHDPRRHQLTPAERQLGGQRGYAAAKAAVLSNVQRWAWLYRRIRGHFRAKRRLAKGGGR